jgi:hypothetical protein
MAAITTLFRAVVMLATLAIVFKGWQLYGPSSEQLRSFAARAVELADEWLATGRQPVPADATPPAVAAPPAWNADASSATVAMVEPPRLEPAPVAQSAPAEQPGDDDQRRLQALLAWLERLGARDTELQPWGASGQLYRFTCRASWADTPKYTRHFESVAAEPLLAVEQVASKVDAWRSAQRGSTQLR